MAWECTPLLRRQVIVFIIGWLGYASTYFLRKPLGVIKADLESDMKIDKSRLGWLDTALFLPYALIQVLLGPLGDKFGPRRTYGLCMLIAGASMISFGHWSNFYIFFLLLFINGSAQSQCWPNTTKILGLWFNDDIRNSVFGVFGTCAFMGGVLGTACAVYLQKAYGWRSVFFTPSIFVIIMGIAILLLYNVPSEVGIDSPKKEIPTDKSEKNTPSYLSLWKTPMIPEIAIGVLCLKTVRYCLIMWLPMYLLQQLNYTKTEAGMFSTAFEIGGVAGSAALGVIIDRLFKGRPLAGSYTFILLSSVSLIVFICTSNLGIAINTVFMFLAGAFNCGPDTILGASVPASIGDSNGRNSGAAMVGLVNGFGSIGMFIEGPLIGFIASYFGWSGMFYLMIIVSVCGTLAIYRSSVIHDKQQREMEEALPEAVTL